MPPGMIPDDDASHYGEEVEIEGLAPIEESEDSYDEGEQRALRWPWSE